ncbi:MAG: L,D-transpeptidase family protein [Gemmatimonadales bacterium]|nr:L,D-transpeptidase family protein [Gemmatimonadales bacterium]MDZ4390620.1 L,D-transpeptidase family protein [Gemmatimonadales bacterium]
MLAILLLLASAPPASDSTQLAAAIRKAPAPLRVALTRSYRAREWQPLWSIADQPSPAARRLVRELGQAADRGLDPQRFDAPRLHDLLNAWDTTASARANFDAALSVAVLRYARALDRGVVDPVAIHPTLALRRAAFDDAAVLTALGAGDPVAVLRGLEPPFYQYQRLLAVLQGFRVMLPDTALTRLPAWSRVVHADSLLPGAPALRRLLIMLGDLPWGSSAPDVATDTVYDASLQSAVTRFQRRHGLTPDGVLGPATRRSLERSTASRIRQIELTLERWRWLPREQSAAPIIVNIPAFRLDALRALPELEAETLSMDVVVGTAVTHGTPLLAARLRQVVFQPWWNLPRSIAMEEIRPKALLDSSFLAREGYELRRDRKPIAATPGAIDSIGIDVWVHQRPGPLNALGRVKFLMPNGEDIYLHDTPSQALFSRLRRDFSHGCIRVADPGALAAFVLRSLPDWNPDRVAEVMGDTVTVAVTLPEPVPVFLVYHSVEVRENGEAWFHPDVYGHDALLAEEIRRPGNGRRDVGGGKVKGEK